MTKGITSGNMKKIYMIGLLVFSSQWVMGQCSGNTIKSFTLQNAKVVDQAQQKGEISVEVQGGEPPFIYRLIADYRGQGAKKLFESTATKQREYTFYDVPANTSFFYRVEVQSNNEGEVPSLEAVCQKRIIPTIELK